MFSPETLLNSASQAIVATDVDGTIVFWNRAAEDLYGWTAEEAVGRHLRDTVAEDDPLGERSPLFDELRAGRSWLGVRRLRHHEGTLSVILLTATPIRDAEGAVAGFLAVSTPLDHFELPRVVGESEQLYREIVETAHEGIWVLNERDQTTFVNKRLAEMLGYSVGEMLGLPMSRFVDGAGRSLAAEHGERYRAGYTAQLELNLRRQDGTMLSALLETRPLFRNDGAYGGIRATIIDISERRAAEEQLREREAQMRDALKTARIAGWGWDIASDAIEGTVELLEILNLSESASLTFTELLNHNIHPQDRERVAEAFHRAQTEDLPLDGEHRLRTPGGIERVLHVRGRRVVDQSGKAVRIVGIVQDVTERRRLESRLLQADRISSLGRLAASVAHEFNNVLMGIQPFVDLLTRRAGSDPTVMLAAPRIADAVARGKRITQEILRFTRISEPTRITVNVAEWLHAFEPELAQIAGPKVTVTIEAQPSLTMLADAHQMRQVFVNLVINAHHAMPNGGRFEVRALADTMRDRNEHLLDAVHLSVSDTGVGMPQETLRYIFEPLFTTKKLGGTGLGLAIVSQIIQQHEGQIYAESVLNEGTTFHILIPAGEALTPSAQNSSHPHQRAAFAGTRLTLIEDDESVGAGLAAILDLEGIAVDWVRLGLHATDRIAANLPDAVILDLGLPDIDGVKLYKEIAARWPDLPILFSTGHGDETVLADVRSPHVGYLQKPYELDALLAALEKVLRK